MIVELKRHRVFVDGAVRHDGHLPAEVEALKFTTPIVSHYYLLHELTHGYTRQETLALMVRELSAALSVAEGKLKAAAHMHAPIVIDGPGGVFNFRIHRLHS